MASNRQTVIRTADTAQSRPTIGRPWGSSERVSDVASASDDVTETIKS